MVNSIFATGTSGTIGRYLSNEVSKLKFDITNLPNDLSEIKNATIIHLASRVGPSEVERDPIGTYKINVQGSADLAKLAIKSNCKRFVFISTSHVYRKQNSPIREMDDIEPLNRYAEQKFQTELMLEDLFSQQSKSQLLILRIFSIIGLESKPYTLGGAIKRILDGEPGLNISNASDVRDFMTPNAVARAIESLSREQEIREKILNICSGVGTSVIEAALHLARTEGRTLQKDRFQTGNSEVPFIVGDPSLLKRYIVVDPLLD